MRFLALRVVVVVSLSVLLFACSYSDRMPDLPTHEMPRKEVAALQSWYLQQVVPLRSFKNLYSVRQDNPKTSYRYAVVFDAPNAFRLEMFPDTGFYSLGLFILNGKRVLFLDESAKKGVVSDDARLVFKDLFGIPVSPADLPYILAGQIPGRFFEDESLKFYRLNGGDIGIVHPAFAEYWEFSAETGQLRKVQLRDSISERFLAEITLSETIAEGAELPESLVIEIPLADTTVTLQLAKSKLNIPIQSELFTPGVPEHFEMEYKGVERTN